MHQPDIRRSRTNALLALAMACALTGVLQAQQQGSRGGRTAGPPSTARASAPIDVTGYWVSVITEDWRFRMVTPPKGDYSMIPLAPEGRRVAGLWEPAADERAGNQCKAYGAAGIMRIPGRLRITWQNDDTLHIDTDAGTQTRVLHFTTSPARVQRSWQGRSTARWDGTRALTVVTTQMRAGYLRRNGVPYSENATLTEYFDVAPYPDGGRLLIVTSQVDDPRFLQRPYVLSTHFKQEPDGSRWSPTPCTAHW